MTSLSRPGEPDGPIRIWRVDTGDPVGQVKGTRAALVPAVSFEVGYDWLAPRALGSPLLCYADGSAVRVVGPYLSNESLA